MENYMPKIAKMLGVELDEEFEIVNSFNGEWIANACMGRYCLHYSDYNASYKEFSGYTLEGLLTGMYTIKRKPWKPQDDEEYWLVGLNGRISSDVFCKNRLYDINLYKIGNCYRTKAEAMANRDKWVEFYKSDKVLEV